MDFDLREELKLLQNTVRNFVDRELIPIEMTAMDGDKLRPEIRVSSNARPRSWACGCSMCRRSMVARASISWGWWWSGRSWRVPSPCRRAVRACSART